MYTLLVTVTLVQRVLAIVKLPMYFMSQKTEETQTQEEELQTQKQQSSQQSQQHRRSQDQLLKFLLGLM